MGPDCGTAIVNGYGLGFANRVRRGNIGVVAASGTGAQAVTVGIHQNGGGVSQAFGTGGRDLKPEVGGRTALLGVELLGGDPATDVIVLISKPAAPEVATRLLQAALKTGKPIVVVFLGLPFPARRIGHLHFAVSLAEAAELAVLLADSPREQRSQPAPEPLTGDVRALYSGGTLAYELLLALQATFTPLTSNIPLRVEQAMADVWHSQGHVVLDLGEDEFTQGRLHPMLDNDLRLRRLEQEGADPALGALLLDVVLGDGAHPDPASELAPALEALKAQRPELLVSVLLVGTDSDPQGLESQRERFEAAGATVHTTVVAVVAELNGRYFPSTPATSPFTPDFAAVNIGLESFYESLIAQGGKAVQVDWRPPAGGNEKMLSILAKLKSQGKTS